MRSLFLLILSGCLFACAPAFAVPTTITAQVLGETGLEPVYANADTGNGNRVLNPNGDVGFVFKNPGASAAVVTVEVAKASVYVNGFGTVSKSDIVCNLAAGEYCHIGALNTLFWNTGGYIVVNYSGAGSGDVDVIAVRMPKP